jgi:hypothetical protein
MVPSCGALYRNKNEKEKNKKKMRIISFNKW